MVEKEKNKENIEPNPTEDVNIEKKSTKKIPDKVQKDLESTKPNLEMLLEKKNVKNVEIIRQEKKKVGDFKRKLNFYIDLPTNKPTSTNVEKLLPESTVDKNCKMRLLGETVLAGVDVEDCDDSVQSSGDDQGAGVRPGEGVGGVQHGGEDGAHCVDDMAVGARGLTVGAEGSAVCND